MNNQPVKAIVKQGDKFALQCQYVQKNPSSGALEPAPLPYGIYSSIADNNNSLVANLTITRVDADQGQYTISMDFSALAPGIYQQDVCYTDGDQTVVHSETWLWEVRRAPTQVR